MKLVLILLFMFPTPSFSKVDVDSLTLSDYYAASEGITIEHAEKVYSGCGSSSKVAYVMALRNISKDRNNKSHITAHEKSNNGEYINSITSKKHTRLNSSRVVAQNHFPSRDVTCVLVSG